MRQQAERHILEGGRRAVEELQKTVSPRPPADTERRGEGGVEISAERACVGLGPAKPKGAERTAAGEGGIVQITQGGQIQLRDLGGRHDVQAAVRGETVHHSLGGRNRGRAAAGAEIEHTITSC